MADRPPVRVCLIGFGHVGQAVARLLLSKRWPFEVKVCTSARAAEVRAQCLDGEGWFLLGWIVDGRCDSTKRWEFGV